jgi:serine/threonine protein phosphatase PrpC
MHRPGEGLSAATVSGEVELDWQLSREAGAKHSCQMIPFAARTHPGLRRGANEDNYSVDEALGLWIVADGLGGHSNGEIASAIACEVINREVRGGASLSDAIAQAHRALLEEIERRDIESNMGTTVVALLMTGRDYQIAWVGDSRAYLYDGGLKQLTADHSAIGELLAKGAIDARKAAKHPQRHALSRSLGVSETNEAEAGVVSGTLKANQQLLLCTDGVTDELSDAQILGELRINGSPDEQAEGLVKAALAGGGRDNLTLILVGSRAAKPTGRREPAPSLETTQNIGEPVKSVTPRRKALSYSAILLLLAAAIAGITLWKML